jgi:lipopolysaccharide transport system ATP-binding protein
MSDIAVRVDGVSKQFRLGQKERYRTLRDTLTDAVTAPFRRFGSKAKAEAEAEMLWALKDVSLEVKHGEVLGIIGRNGAGKSTLLKILSRITEPTEGRVEIHGRVGSLLEVGTGFHPELTGRENIFLNGAILGMKKAEIARKFDEIVAFAEVEKFVDTAVKHYSSGMYVRLAFAVAAHMEPEILVVDEVLAVGDLEFQKKCLGKMGDVAKGGKTVLLVSHSMASIISLCDCAAYLRAGRLEKFGIVQDAVANYLESGAGHSSHVDLRRASVTRSGTGDLRFVAARILDESLQTTGQIVHGKDLYVEAEINGSSAYANAYLAIMIRTLTGITVLHIPTLPDFSLPFTSGLESVIVRCKIPNCGLYPGTYIVSFWLGRNAYQELDHAYDALTFSIEPGPLARYGFDMSWRHGLYFCDNGWEIIRQGELINPREIIADALLENQL